LFGHNVVLQLVAIPRIRLFEDRSQPDLLLLLERELVPALVTCESTERIGRFDHGDIDKNSQIFNRLGITQQQCCYRKGFLSFASGGFPHHLSVTAGQFQPGSAYIFTFGPAVKVSGTLGRIIAPLTLTCYALRCRVVFPVTSVLACQELKKPPCGRRWSIYIHFNSVPSGSFPAYFLSPRQHILTPLGWTP